MSEEELFLANHDTLGFTVYMDSCFSFEPSEGPYVMVADEEMDLYSFVS